MLRPDVAERAERRHGERGRVEPPLGGRIRQRRIADDVRADRCSRSRGWRGPCCCCRSPGSSATVNGRPLCERQHAAHLPVRQQCDRTRGLNRCGPARTASPHEAHRAAGAARRSSTAPHSAAGFEAVLREVRRRPRSGRTPTHRLRTCPACRRASDRDAAREPLLEPRPAGCCTSDRARDSSIVMSPNSGFGRRLNGDGLGRRLVDVARRDEVAAARPDVRRPRRAAWRRAGAARSRSSAAGTASAGRAGTPSPTAATRTGTLAGNGSHSVSGRQPLASGSRRRG